MADTAGWDARTPYYTNPNVLDDSVRTGAVDDRHISQLTVNPPWIYQADMDSDPRWIFV